MALYEIRRDEIARASDTSFAVAAIRERQERLLRDGIERVPPGTMVLARELGRWREIRIDRLGLDETGEPRDRG